MTLIAFIFFFICTGIVVSTLPRGTDVFSPARVFGFVWCFAIALSELKLSRLQHEWSMQDWIILLIGPVSFLIGNFIQYIMNLNSHLISLEKIRNGWQKQIVDANKLYMSIIVVSAIFLIAYLILVLIGRDIPILSARPGLARKNFQLFGIGLLINNVVIVIFLTVVYYFSQINKQFKKISLGFISVFTFLLYSITLQRLALFTAVIVSFVFIYYFSKKIRLSIIFIFFIILASVFLLSTVRSGLSYSISLFISSKMRVSRYWAVITEPYMYIVMNLEMFVHSINRLEQHTYGYYTFDFITALTGLKHWISDYFNLDETPFVYSPYNTYTAFWTYYRDFGIIGTSFIGLSGGYGISALYYSLRRSPRYTSLTIYCFSVYIMMLSIFNSQVGFLWIVYEVAVIYIIVSVSINKSQIE